MVTVHIPTDSHTASRAAHLQSFLRSRELSVAELSTEAQTRIGPGEVYFVSTAVHGLAGSTSDIDMIVISSTRIEGAARMSTMAFVKSSRLGIKHYSQDEVANSLAYLAELSGESAGELQSKVDAWSAPVPWIDLERLINGLRDDMACPLESSLGDLCAARFSYSFGLFREALLFGCLAQRAGERRSPYGYLLHALPHLMDAVLACEGDVLTNAKWTTQRWSVSQCADRPEWRIVKEWWQRAWIDLTAQGEPPDAAEMLNLYDRSVSALGLSLEEDDQPLSWRQDLKTTPFSEGVHLTEDVSGRLVLHGVAAARRNLSLRQLCSLEHPEEAQALLSFARANFVDAKLRQSMLAGVGRALYLGQAP